MRELPMNAKIVIVGGGIVGASVAYHLAAKGVADVVLLEQNTMTSGTTWHAAGLVGQLRATQNMTRLASYGAELYEQLELDGFPTGFKRTGSIAVANNEERLEELVRGADMASCFDIDIQHVDVDTLASHWPLMHTDDLIGGVWVPRDGQTSPVDTTMALANAAKQMGARIFENTGVAEIMTTGGSGILLAVVLVAGPLGSAPPMVTRSQPMLLSPVPDSGLVISQPRLVRVFRCTAASTSTS